MKTVDFSRSFLYFCTDWAEKPSRTASHKPPYELNTPRIQLDCVCTIEDEHGFREEFVLGANCKTEIVGVDANIWLNPNADFVPVLGREKMLAMKTYDRVGTTVPFHSESMGDQPDRQISLLSDAFTRAGFDIARTKGEVLETAEDIVNATLANEVLVASTQLKTPRYTVTLEYPIKTMYVNERDWVYQTDTGPVLIPDLDLEPVDLIAGMQLAFSAFNCPDWIEFIIRVPTPIADGISVYHYSQSTRWDAVNQVIRLLVT